MKFSAVLLFSLFLQPQLTHASEVGICQYFYSNLKVKQKLAREAFQEAEKNLKELHLDDASVFVSKNRAKIYRTAIQECGSETLCTPEQFQNVLKAVIATNSDEISRGGNNIVSAQNRLSEEVNIKQMRPYRLISGNAFKMLFLIGNLSKLIRLHLPSLQEEINMIEASGVLSIIYATTISTVKSTIDLFKIGSSAFAIKKGLRKDLSKIDLRGLRDEAGTEIWKKGIHDEFLKEYEQPTGEFKISSLLVDQYLEQQNKAIIAKQLGSTTSVGWSILEEDIIAQAFLKYFPTDLAQEIFLEKIKEAAQTRGIENTQEIADFYSKIIQRNRK